MFPDISEVFKKPDADTEPWTNLYFFHFSIDGFYGTVSGNVNTVFNIVPLIILGFIAIIINSWALRKIITHRVKANRIGREVCKLAIEYVGGVGPSIVNNVCINKGYSLNNISKNEVISLSNSIGKALGAFAGTVMAKEILDEVNRIAPVYIDNYQPVPEGKNLIRGELGSYDTNVFYEIEGLDLEIAPVAENDIYL